MPATKSYCGCRRWRGILVVVGGVIIHLSLGTLYTFGNLNPYLTSFMRKYGSASTLTYTECSWIFALAIMGQGLSIMIGGIIERVIGPKLTVLLGGWCMSLGVMLTYFTVKYSFALTIITYGAVFGIGIGTAYAAPLGCAMRWFPEWKGLVNGVVVAGFGGGALIFDQIQTTFINPDNLKPDIEIDGDKYFSQQSVLEKVPWIFVLIGGCYAVMQLIGSLLLCNPPSYESDDAIEMEKYDENAATQGEDHSAKPAIEIENFDENAATQGEDHSAKPAIEIENFDENAATQGEDHSAEPAIEIENFDENAATQGEDRSAEPAIEIENFDENAATQGEDRSAKPAIEIENFDENAATQGEDHSAEPAIEKENFDENAATQGEDRSAKPVEISPGPLNKEGTMLGFEDDFTLKPLEVLRSKHFYFIWFMFLFNGQGMVFISSLYKAYGQTFISDDNFMAVVGSFAALFNAFGRIMWGTIADKFSFQVSALFMCAAFTCLMLTFQLSDIGGKPVFFIYVCLLFGSFSGSFALFPTATAKCFGRKYLSINYGFVFTSQIITAPLGVFLSQKLKSALGWNGLFFLVSGFSFISFLLSMLFSGKDKKGNPI